MHQKPIIMLESSSKLSFAVILSHISQKKQNIGGPSMKSTIFKKKRTSEIKELNSVTVLEIMRCCDFGTKTRSDINVI